jgi:hypothetical protein
MLQPRPSGKLTGAKPPLLPKHVWSIRTKLQIEGRARDLAMFNLAIDRKLRGCDVVALRVEDVVAGGYTADRAIVRQKKTGRPVRFELSEQTRQAVDDYLKPMANYPPSSCLLVIAVPTAAWQPANMPASSPSGSAASDWTRGCSGRIHYAAQKLP